VLFKKIDTDGSGDLSFEEFYEWYADLGFQELQTEAGLQADAKVRPSTLGLSMHSHHPMPRRPWLVSTSPVGLWPKQPRSSSRATAHTVWRVLRQQSYAPSTRHRTLTLALALAFTLALL
jgi:hypothetical protein